MATFSGSPHPTVVSGKQATVAVKPDGSIQSWGSGGLVPAPALSNVISVTANDDWGVALHSDGTVTFIGVAPGGTGVDSVPAMANVVHVDSGKYAAIATHSDGTVTGWGYDYGGVLSIPAGLSDVKMVAVGEQFAVALKNDGTLVDWGTRPQAAPALSNVVYVSCYRDSVLALLDDGTVQAWGANSLGQTSVPPGLSGVVSIAACAGTSLAVKDDGTAVVWGDTTNAPTGVVTAFAAAPGFEARGIVHGDGSLTMWSFGMGGDTSVPVSFEAMLPGASQAQDYIDSVVSINATITGKKLPVASLSATVPITADITGLVGPLGEIGAHVGITASFVGYQDWLSKIPAVELQEVYRLILTGAEDGLDDLIIGKLSSWQATNQSGDRSAYLQAVIPDAESYLSDISDRQNGQLIMQKGYRLSSGQVRYEEIVRARFDQARPDQGRRSLTLTVSGYMAGKPVAIGERTLTGVRMISKPNGKRRVRCNIDLFLQPGMTVHALGETFQAGFINYYVNQSDKFCEVGER